MYICEHKCFSVFEVAKTKMKVVGLIWAAELWLYTVFLSQFYDDKWLRVIFLTWRSDLQPRSVLWPSPFPLRSAPHTETRKILAEKDINLLCLHIYNLNHLLVVIIKLSDYLISANSLNVLNSNISWWCLIKLLYLVHTVYSTTVL